jgi:hypothetical protein
MIKEGTCWTGLGGKVFLVLKKIELDGHTWIHYRDYRHNIEDQVREYSCYEESFLERFHVLPECPKER